MIHATVVQVSNDETTFGRGKFEFVCLPSPGDTIVLGSGWSGGIDFLSVLFVQHNPVAIPPIASARPDATMTVFVRFVRSEGGLGDE